MSSDFNLLDEKWIRVVTMDYEEIEISLSDALLHAEQYRQLSGEMPAQDIAVERMLLGLLYAVFSREAADGTERGIASLREALERWREIWDLKAFPQAPLQRYFEKYHDRFWLFDDERPFYQSPKAADGTLYPASKLNGAISQSNNKIRMFSERAGDGADKLTYPESARWLIYLNGFDDAGVKKPSPKGVGWLGQLGLIEAVGDNLFETLMLNMVFTRGNTGLWEPTSASEGKCPCWEKDAPESEPRKEIPQPDNFSQLMTLQSRLIKLKRENGFVTGYNEYAGNFFDKKNALVEPMTLWRKTKDGGLTPKTHDQSRQIWREFGSIMAKGDGDLRPGIVQWNSKLYDEYGDMSFNDRFIRYRITAARYGAMFSAITNSFSDTIAMSARLLGEIGAKWNNKIVEEIQKCDKCANEVDRLSHRLRLAAGYREKEVFGSKAMEQFYAELDPFFRRWLYDLDPDPAKGPEDEDGEIYVESLENGVKKIAFRLGRRMAEAAGIKPVRRITEGSQTNFYWTPQEYERFKVQVSKIYKNED